MDLNISELPDEIKEIVKEVNVTRESTTANIPANYVLVMHETDNKHFKHF